MTRLVSCDPDFRSGIKEQKYSNPENKTVLKSGSGSDVTQRWAVRSVRSVKTSSSRLSAEESDSDAEIVDVGAAKTLSSRPKTAFQASVVAIVKI